MLNDDILLGIFNCYRLDGDNGWNIQLGWRKLSHVCQRWQHLIYGCALYLGVHIKCTNGTPTLDALDHLPPLPLFINYGSTLNSSGNYYETILTDDDEFGIYHALQLHDRVRHIDLDLPTLLPSILHEVLVLMDKHFPILEHLSLSFAGEASITLALPKAFLAPNLRHLSLFGIGLPKGLQLLASTPCLVTLKLRNIENSSYFPPRLFITRLGSLPKLKELSIGFSAPIPRLSTETERECLGEQEIPVTLPSLKIIWFEGVGTYLESLVAQIRAPLLEHLHIASFHPVLAIPHLSYLVNTTEAFKAPSARIGFDRDKVYVTIIRDDSEWLEWEPFRFCVKCDQLDGQIDGAVQICHALIPALSSVKQLTLYLDYWGTPIEYRNIAIASAKWHDLLRSFIGVKMLYINGWLSEELSRALQVDEVGSNPGFLPNLRFLHTWNNHMFTSFIETRQAVGRPVQLSRWY